ncbi:hypothetical protein R1flu_010027 [Riccia fluitans]|uniref:Cilia- and flagella-associated protein 263 n=1 Tax=Riccia fluitans TaxID=41844 RepID=A0ABD1Z4L8_9MARC
MANAADPPAPSRPSRFSALGLAEGGVLLAAAGGPPPSRPSRVSDLGLSATAPLPTAAAALAVAGAVVGRVANDSVGDESTEAIPEPPRSDEEILDMLLKEEEHLKNENALLSDYLLRVAASKATSLSEISEESSDSSEEEMSNEHASRSSITQSQVGRGSILEGVASRRSSAAGYPGLRAPSLTKTEVSVPQSPNPAIAPVLDSEEKNEIAIKECAAMKEEIENSIGENERLLDELRAAFDEANLRIGEVRRDRADFQRDVLADAKAKGPRKDNAGKILKFMEQKLSKKSAKALKVRERNAALNLQIAKTEQLLANKKELADLLHAVDFEQLQIHKQQNQQRLRERTQELNKLKSSNAKASEENLACPEFKAIQLAARQLYNALDYQSWQLSSQIRRRYTILEQLVEREPQLTHVKKDISRVTKKKERLEDMFHIFIQERDAQLGEAQPNVLEYMELKERVHNLRKEHRTWIQKVEIAELVSQQPSAHQSERDAFSVNDMIGQELIQEQDEAEGAAFDLH